MGADHQLLHGIVHFPIIVPHILTAGFLDPIGSGFQIDASGSVLTGNESMELLSAGFVRIDGDMPAGDFVSCIGRFREAAQTLLFVQPLVNGGFPILHGDGVVAQFRSPIGIVGGRFQNDILSGSQIGNTDDAGFIRGKGGIGNFRAVLLYDELPAAQMIARIGGLPDFQRAYGQLVVKADSCGSTVGHCDFLRIVFGTGVAGRNAGVGMSKLFNVVCSCVQPGDADFTAAVRRIGAGYQRGAGSVGIQGKTPAGQILAVLRGFHQSNGSGIRGIDLEVGPQCIHLGRIQLDAGLVSAAGTVVNGYGGVFRRGQTPGSTE